MRRLGWSIAPQRLRELIRALERHMRMRRSLRGGPLDWRRTTYSLPWHLMVNVFAGSAGVHWHLRWRLLRRCGLDVQRAYVMPGCHFYSYRVAIGAQSWINRGCHFDSHAQITIGRNVDVGMEVMFCTSSHRPGPATKRAGEYVGAPIVVGDGTWIGTRAAILPGVTVPEGCVIAAGSVVVRDCAPHGFYAGVPAKRIRDLPSDAAWQGR
jgi:acetyltransferase-like isoleucine patch superfamily enzyme